MLEVDSIGRKSFTVYYTLSRNRYSLNSTTLANTGANAFALLNTKCVKKLSEYLDTLLEPLETRFL